MLDYLNLKNSGLISFHQKKHDGIHLVIRSLNNDKAIDRLAHGTSINEDHSLFSRMTGHKRSASIRLDKLSEKEKERIRDIAPEVTASKTSELTAFQSDNTFVVAGRYNPVRADGPFVKKGDHIEVPHAARKQLEDEIFSKMNYALILDVQDTREAIKDAIEDFSRGIINKDSMIVWKAFFQSETDALPVSFNCEYLFDEPGASDFWAPFLERLDQEILIKMHPGICKAYVNNNGANVLPVDAMSCSVKPSNSENKYDPLSFLDRTDLVVADIAMTKALFEKNGSAQIATHGFVEVGRTEEKTILLSVKRLSIPNKLYLFDNLMESALENHLNFKASKDIEIINSVKQDPGNQVVEQEHEENEGMALA